jgi:tRNA/rRNA methyltransferase
MLRIRVVLVRPRRGGNVGAVARAMKNMGLSDLALVAPRTRAGVAAARMAAHARDVLDARRIFPDLATAVSDCILTVGTVGRGESSDGAPAAGSGPRRVAAEIVLTARRGRVAVVFGPEDHGLSNSDLALCQRTIRIPTAAAYPSLNLAQAAGICAYEIRVAAQAAERPGASHGSARISSARNRTRSAEHRPATSGEREALFAHLGRALAEIGFLSPQNPTHILRDLRSLFARSGLTARDVQIWRGIARQILWAAGERRKLRRPKARQRRFGAPDSDFT